MAKTISERKIYVLDTSVIIHDHNSIMNFKEHDVAIPITVLEELDNFKRGNDTKNFEARQFIRMIDKLSGSLTLNDWLPLNGPKKGKFRIVMQNEVQEMDAERIFRDNKADHRILNTALTLREQEKNARVILVTKDINLRIKAKALELEAQDYETGKIKDLTSLNTGISNIENIESEVIRKIFTDGSIENIDFLGKSKRANQFYILKNGKSSALAFYNPVKDLVERVEKLYTYGIKPKNAEQT
ncbi:MAG TPA: ribonuclease, partial [Flavobacteriales bacterium]|nr:ribonuclease [Flavobacteriales bacterium]